MSESDTMFNEQDRRCAAVQLMLFTDPSYNNRTIASTLKIQIWIATNDRDVPRVMKTNFPVTVMVFGVVSSEGHIMPPLIFEVGLKVNTKMYLDVLKRVVISWCNQAAYFIENITNMTSHNTKASLIAAIRRVFAELPLALVEKACS